MQGEDATRQRNVKSAGEKGRTKRTRRREEERGEKGNNEGGGKETGEGKRK